LAKLHPDVPIVPVFMHGLGKALPKGESILVPFFCDVFVGKPLPSNVDKKEFMKALNDSMLQLASELPQQSWA
jgi:1-acyl-sn-glycerol-3-phosphate acyltransferase